MTFAFFFSIIGHYLRNQISHCVEYSKMWISLFLHGEICIQHLWQECSFCNKYVLQKLFLCHILLILNLILYDGTNLKVDISKGMDSVAQYVCCVAAET